MRFEPATLPNLFTTLHHIIHLCLSPFQLIFILIPVYARLFLCFCSITSRIIRFHFGTKFLFCAFVSDSFVFNPVQFMCVCVIYKIFPLPFFTYLIFFVRLSSPVDVFFYHRFTFFVNRFASYAFFLLLAFLNLVLSGCT